MKYEDIYADKCTVHWKVPKDDGGSRITHYIIEKMEMEQTQSSGYHVEKHLN